MQTYHKSILTLLLLFCSVTIFAQNNKANLDTLMVQGTKLHNQGKYAEAIEKYAEVLKADPENGFANYETAFSLYAQKKPQDAIPYLEKVVKTNNENLNVAALCLLASIYDGDHQTQKAVDNYEKGIKINPNYPQIYYNLSLTYLRNNQYDLAEKNIIEALKRNPNHIGNLSVYALSAYRQNKKVNALMAFCSVISLGSTTPTAASAFNNIQNILNGSSINQDGKTTINISPNDAQETSTLNLGLSMVTISAKTKNLQGADLLTDELTTLFKLTGELAEKKTEKTFFDLFFADYYYKLAQTEYMPAFARLMAINTDRDGTAKWGKENMAQLTGMAQWLHNTPRKF
ncbi:tetratricopeptide repeat protein [Mucilaginibacter sp. UYCu711]|uniref:tetratricopeptide repeat protein n=1 Tax=Mucilaginibacter sp. UYCu711 TaxID=3156339 RepID=UPI003D225D0C